MSFAKNTDYTVLYKYGKLDGDVMLCPNKDNPGKAGSKKIKIKEGHAKWLGLGALLFGILGVAY